MAIYRRGGTYWYKFKFAGRMIRRSAKTKSKSLARQVERKHHQAEEEGINGIIKRQTPIPFSVAADKWLRLKKPSLAARSHQIEETNIEKHLNPSFRSRLITDISAEDIADYQQRRKESGAAPGTIRLELGTLRAILRRHRLWGQIQPDVKFPRGADDVGRALSADEETNLLAECSKSRSRMLLPFVTLALHTGMRHSEIRLLRWQQIDLHRLWLRVGKSKTESGTGRGVPLNATAHRTLEEWANQFPARKGTDYVFPAERYGLAGDDAVPHAYDTDPSQPINSLKEAWESAKDRANVICRFHDLRHTACTRMLERGVPLSVVGSILGWSAATTVRMAKRYGHIGDSARVDAVSRLETPATRETTST